MADVSAYIFGIGPLTTLIALLGLYLLLRLLAGGVPFRHALFIKILAVSTAVFVLKEILQIMRIAVPEGLMFMAFSFMLFVSLYYYNSRLEEFISAKAFMDIKEEYIGAFMIPPQLEKAAGTKLAHHLNPAEMYLSEERDSRGYGLFVDYVKHGHPGLCITMEPAERIRDRHGLKKTPIIEIRSRFTRTLRLEELGSQIAVFMKKARRGIVMMDCFERIMTRTSFDDALKLLQDLRDVTARSSSIFLLSINPDILDKRQLALVRSEAKVIY